MIQIKKLMIKWVFGDSAARIRQIDELGVKSKQPEMCLERYIIGIGIYEKC